MTLHQWRVSLVFVFGFSIFSLSHGQDFSMPPKFEGRDDFEGNRFIVWDKDRENSLGLRPYMMRLGSIMKEETPPEWHPFSYSPDGITLNYLTWGREAEAEEEGDDGDTDEDQDTMIRYVPTLNELRGFVKIRTETDAIEFLRFGSSLHGAFQTGLQEIYCISDSSIIPNPMVDLLSDVFWLTVQECGRYNLTSPRVLNPLSQKERARLKEGGDDEEDEKKGAEKDKETPRRKSERFFLIERSVYARQNRRNYPLSPVHNKLGVYRIVEEVGPAGQWRVVSTQQIPLSDEAVNLVLSRR